MRITNIIGQFIAKIMFRGSKNYWINNYEKGGNSGEGSYNIFAKQKGEMVNDFIRTHNIKKIIELGCGDGNQLSYYNLNNVRYYGFDVSEKAINLCKEKHKHYLNKSFFVIDDNFIVPKATDNTIDLALSMDVIFHLIEDTVFYEHLDILFNSSQKYVMIFGVNIENTKNEPAHVKHRMFVPIILDRFKDWELYKIIKSKTKDERFILFPDMYIFRKVEK